jgi:hypothetical protein
LGPPIGFRIEKPSRGLSNEFRLVRKSRKRSEFAELRRDDFP